MAQTTVRIERNGLRAEGARLHGALVQRMEHVAPQLRDALRSAMEGGALPLQPDTHALAVSLAVQTNAGSDFAEARGAAKAAYVGNPSQWREPVQHHVTPDAYSDGHFEERAATSAPPLHQEEHIARAAVLTMLAWGQLWEYGHNNLFTGQEERRPWMGPFCEVWWAEEGQGAFAGMATA